MADSVCKKRKVSTSKSEGQDTPESQDKLCDICDVEQKEPADGFCQQCGQNLCNKCCLHHGKIVGTKHHTIRKPRTDEDSRTNNVFGKRVVPWTVVTLPQFPMKQGISNPKIKYVNFFKDTGKMIVLCKYPQMEYYAFFELKDGKYGRHSIGLLEREPVMCLDTKHNQVVLTNPGDRNDYIVSTLDINEPYFKKTEMFRSTGDCRSIVEFDDGFAILVKVLSVLSISSSQINCVDRKGNLKKVISHCEKGKAYFGNPNYLASNYNQSKLYVSDSGKNNIRAFNIAGELLFTFSHKDLMSPGPTTLDTNCNIYLISRDKLIQVEAGAQEQRILLSTCNSRRTFGTCSAPVAVDMSKSELGTEAVAFDMSKDLLVLGTNDCQTLQHLRFV